MVSVVIPTYNGAAWIAPLLRVLGNQSVECEVIVIDSSSSDDTAGIALSLGARVIVIPREKFNHGGTRNLAVTHSSGEIIVFLTQDAIPFDDRSVENLVKPLEDPLTAAAYGRQVPREDAAPTERFARGFNYPGVPSVRTWADVAGMGIRAFFFSNAFSAVRRKEFEAIGGFPEDLIMFEDMLYAASLMRSGYSVAYIPEAMAVHSHALGLREQFARYARAGSSFSSHPWFLEYGRAGGEGVRFLAEEMKYLLRSRRFAWCFYAMAEGAVKYAGYNSGLKGRGILSLGTRVMGVSLNE